MNNQKRVALIEQRLTELFNPDYLKITDESHHHAGHVGAKDGRGHFAIQISASAFNDKKTTRTPPDDLYGHWMI